MLFQSEKAKDGVMNKSLTIKTQNQPVPDIGQFEEFITNATAPADNEKEFNGNDIMDEAWNSTHLGRPSVTKSATHQTKQVHRPMPGSSELPSAPAPTPPSAQPTAGSSHQPGLSHSTQAAGPSKGPSNRYKGGQKRAADEDVKDLGSTKRCRKFRENKKSKLSEEEEEVKALEEKNKELTELEEMLIRKLSAAQTAYIRLIKKGMVNFFKT